ncbi:MAG: PTS fructose transporter subunit IIA [Betaproteobacteria bacterium]|nr:PTS fructose transporter subunit IIA [Betaproteobacteria bacterium]
MIPLFIVAHGNLGESLIQCAAHVLGKAPDALESINLSASDDPNEMLDMAQATLDKTDSPNGILLLTDIYGATPCNTVCRLLEPGRIEAVAGVNLPMLLKVLTYRNLPLAELKVKAVEGGVGGVVGVDMERGCACS